MVQKPWFKIFVWFMATFFFFLASVVIISMFRPGPSETDVMRFMSGMMAAMENSIMGIAMSVESNRTFSRILTFSYFMLTPIIAISIVIGFVIRFMQRRGKDV
jgi:TctA family transporter